jgi:transcriptional regulator with XRE-family HTH domain
MNQRELAQASGINAMTISRLVRAQVDKTYRPDKLGTLSVALGWRKDRLASILTEQPARQDDDRLARIEAKLDELLERFDALGKAFYPKG